ncbi:hypothetical protein Daus18300_009188 [Diaporthe australafricana]|uniref:Nephrocystin 3-like N-terminal domain-containing protein n=1 Tax=Diaporthe australafricana TaxID=127596 RepID=A0ABR3WFH8_9PEZI
MIQHGTGRWLLSDQDYRRWSSVADSSASNTDPNLLWLYGDAGFGKSVLCAHAIREQQKLRERKGSGKDVAVAYQFYKMSNEAETSMTAWLNLAEMLLYQRFPQRNDKIPEEMMKLVDLPLNHDRLRRLIELLLREFVAVFIFVDGLDEMVDTEDRNRWSYAEKFLDFILELAVGSRQSEDDFDTVVKVWVSSQERQKIRTPLFSRDPATSTVSSSRPSSSTSALAQIHLTEELNKTDISALVRRKMSALKFDHENASDAEFVDDVINGLQLVVRGNFLWASLILDSITDASSPRQVMEAFEKVPGDFGTYLGTRIEAQLKSHPERRRNATDILSCLVHAERPMFEEEIIEALCASRIPKSGENMRVGDRLFEGQIQEICAPLVRVGQLQVTKDGKKATVCTLLHSAVWSFLSDRPRFLNTASQGDKDHNDDSYTITPRFLGRTCMRYPQQARYKRPLLCPSATEERMFLTSCPERQDIYTHGFLAYCAKYWARHLEYPGAYSKDLCEDIERFVASSHFRTTIQVQSLLVEARFRFMFSAGEREKGRHLVRAFPRFFTELHKPGLAMHRQYNDAIGEFGYYLDSYCSFRGKYPGEIDRCFWGMLGGKNIFHHVSNHLKGFKLELEESQSIEGLTSCFHDNVELRNGIITLFSTVSYPMGENALRLELKVWTVKPGDRPVKQKRQFDAIDVAEGSLELYQRPLSDHRPGRPRVIAISQDGQVCRVGREVFVVDNGLLRRLEIQMLPAEERMDYLEEISNRGPWVAMARRRKITIVDLSREEESPRSHLEESTDEVEDESDGFSSDGFSDSSSYSSSGSESRIEEKEQAKTQQSKDDKQDAAEDKTAEESDLESIDHDSVIGSARWSSSEGSTSAKSDEIGLDEDFWNDWFSDDVHIEDINDDNIFDDLQDPSSSDELFADFGEADDEKESDSDIASHISDTAFDDDASSDDEAGEIVFHGDQRTHPRLPTNGAGTAKDKGTMHLCELIVLNTDLTSDTAADSKEDTTETDEAPASKNASPPLRAFRFARKATGLLFSSPPAIHPTQNLIVWPLGGDEVLFAHFSPDKKTFFTRVLGAGVRKTMCHISIQARFSPCGQYLHFACIDGSVTDARDDADQPIKEIKDLRLRVTTYRLSRRKLARSSPRLIYRTSCPLYPRRPSHGDGRISVAPLPWTLTWDWSDDHGGAHVYACESSRILHVVRAPLFAEVEARERSLDGLRAEDYDGALFAFENTQPVFLPRSADSRRVHFFPHLGGTNGKERKKKSGGGKHSGKGKPGVGDGGKANDPFVVTVIISSEDTDNQPGGDNRGYSGRAQVAHLTRAQFGSWARLGYAKGDGDSSKLKNRGTMRVETWRGQLLSKFEKFDRTDDCDIVPYIR